MSTDTNDHAADARVPSDLVTVTIDGTGIEIPKGTLVIRAAELIGIQIPRFCDHPLLDPVGACRQCLVDVEGQRKPLASCTTTVTEGMVVRTQSTSPAADTAQKGVMELLLINHPLDCPVCDKGGECPLQNQAMSNGRAESRFGEIKRRFPKPIPLSTEVLLDRERCVLCARCTRFSQQIAGDPFIELLERGALEQVGIYSGGSDRSAGSAAGQPFESYFSGNTVQICPVGALTGAAYRFRARPFDLISSPSVCEHCASGCAQRTDHRRGTVLRRLAGDDPQVNEEWNCDKGRWAFAYATQSDRITTPLIRGDEGALVPASWPEALRIAARGLAAARGNTGVLVGGRATWEDSYAYAKFARIALNTNDIDFRIRFHCAEEADFLAARVAGRGLTVSYDDVENAPVVLLIGFEPEEESPMVFLRLRKAARRRVYSARSTGSGVVPLIYSIAPYATSGLVKMYGRLLKAAPGDEPGMLDRLRSGDENAFLAGLLRNPGAVVMIGERAATIPGALSAAVRLTEDTGAALAWVPRRAGERGALEAGALPGLLPGGRPVSDPGARRQVGSVWNLAEEGSATATNQPVVPSTPGRDTSGILAAATEGTLGALVVGGIDVDDLPNPRAALSAIETVPFVVSVELRRSAVTERADIVFPVAPVTEKAGTFLDWEGRTRVFDAALSGTAAMPDQRILDAIAAEMGIDLGLADVAAARRELVELGVWDGESPAPPDVPSEARPRPEPGEAVLACWRMLLDSGRLQDGEPYLAGTARTPVVRLSATTAAEIDVGEGDSVTVSSEHGTITLPLTVTDLPDRVVWLPLNSPGSGVYRQLATSAGSIVGIRSAAAVKSPNPHADGEVR